jgi:hypothetical protein
MSSMFSEFRAGLTAFEAPLDARLAFVRRTYLHVAGAMLAFVGASAAIHSMGVGERILAAMQTGRWVWIAIVVAFSVAGMFAQSMARSHRSAGVQYGGMALFVGIEAVIFSPLIAIAALPQFGHTLPIAAGMTLLAFGALSAFVLTTKKDFSFLGPFLLVASLVALGVIVCGAIFGWNLGLWFSGAMILVAVGSILYSTSRVLHAYRTDEHAAASLELFAGVALLFYYVLMILLQSQRRN